jgi:hypothetical protein
MFQLNEIEMWREHRQELLREADGQRLYRLPGSARPKRKETSLASGVRRIFSVMAVVAVMVTMAVAPAFAVQGGEKPFTYGDCVSELAIGNLEGETPREFNESSEPFQSQGKGPNGGIGIGCLGAPPGN